jgi:O-6-methylguanine DNA methyltransferase
MSLSTHLYDIFHTRFGWIGILHSLNGLRFCVLKETASQALTTIRAESKGSYLCPSTQSHAKVTLQNYMSGREDNLRSITIDLPTKSKFYLDAWEVCRNIPLGETRSYAWVAKEIGRPKSHRGIGRAMACNPIPIVIPCHRVIRSDGSLGGYSGGGPCIKNILLDLEGVIKGSSLLF